MSAASLIKAARRHARLTQAELAERAGTSQAALSVYESGRKDPSASTLIRLLAECDAHLEVRPGRPAAVLPSHPQLERSGRTLSQVMDLAEALPRRHSPRLGYPRLARSAR